MTTLERAARALHAEECRANGVPLDDWAKLSSGQKAMFTDQARAVLTAIREPSDGMIERGISNGLHNQPSGDNPDIDRMATETWQAMIEAALKEG